MTARLTTSAPAGVRTPWTALRSLDDAWLGFLHQLGGTLVRSDDCFVSWLGDRQQLLVANEPDLDADDTLAQIILHELCHHLIQGPDSWHEDDWGLNNMTDDDLPNEHAALRVQAALLSTPLQRQYLQPTTDHRWFYESLGDDPLHSAVHAATDARSQSLALEGHTRWQSWAHRAALQQLLEESERCIVGALSR